MIVMVIMVMIIIIGGWGGAEAPGPDRRAEPGAQPRTKKTTMQMC